MDILNSNEKKNKLRASIVKIRDKYPDRVPIIIEKQQNSNATILIKKNI